MKKILIIILLVVSLKSLAQNSQDCVDSLYSQDYFTKLFAVECVTELKIHEASNVLSELLENQQPYLQMQFLNALYTLNDPNIIIKAHALISRADTFDLHPEYSYDPLDAKVFATAILVYKGDFSSINYVFEQLHRNEITVEDALSIHLLPYIIRGVPSYRDEVKSILLSQLNNTSEEIRYYSISYLAEEFGEEMNQELVNKFINDSDLPIKLKALEYLCINGYSNLNLLLKDQLTLEEKPTLRTDIADTLLLKFGNPSDFKTVKDYQPNEPDETARSLMGFAIREFIPTRPNASITVLNMISNLVNITDTLFNYTWLGDFTFANSLKSKLNQAKTFLLSGDSLSCAIQVKTFQDDVDAVYKDSLNLDPRFVTVEGWKFLYWNAQYILDRLPEPPANPNLVVSLKSSTGTLLTTGSLQYYEGSWKDAVNNGDGTFTVITSQNNVSLRITYEYAQQSVNNIPAHNNTYTFQTVSANVQLRNSQGSLIDTGTVQYYAGAWRSFGTTTNGVVTKELLPINYSFRMTYEYASLDKQQNLSVDPTVVFQTVNAQVQLKNRQGNLIDQGKVQYYAGAWRSFGTTTNGVATKELLPINYSFRMTYEFASIDKQQNLSVDPTVVFQTVNAQVQLKNSLGNFQDVGTVQYYSGAWRSFGTTTNGVATKELLPINYSFRMTHEFFSKDKQQNLSTNPVVEFTTVLCTVKVSNSTNQPFNNASVQYYAGSWRNFGVTNAEGITTKELLPQNISFRASYGSASQDKQQDIGTNNLVEILLNVP